MSGPDMEVRSDDKLMAILDALNIAKERIYDDSTWHPWEDYTSDWAIGSRKGYLASLEAAETSIQRYLDRGHLL